MKDEKETTLTRDEALVLAAIHAVKDTSWEASQRTYVELARKALDIPDIRAAIEAGEGAVCDRLVCKPLPLSHAEMHAAIHEHHETIQATRTQAGDLRKQVAALESQLTAERSRADALEKRLATANTCVECIKIMEEVYALRAEIKTRRELGSEAVESRTLQAKLDAAQNKLSINADSIKQLLQARDNAQSRAHVCECEVRELAERMEAHARLKP